MRHNDLKDLKVLFCVVLIDLSKGILIDKLSKKINYSMNALTQTTEGK
jgi:hypothetical protein